MKKILLVLLTVLLIGSFVFGGVEWTASIKTEGNKKQQNNVMDINACAQDGNVKQIFKGVDRENQFYSQDGYWLYKSGENTIYVVNEKEKSYTPMSVDALMQMTGMMGQMVKIKISEHTVDVKNLGNEKILGYDCAHLKITSEYLMQIKIAFIKKKMRVLEVKEVWGSNDVPGLKEMHKNFLAKNFKTGIPDLDELIRSKMEEQKKIGFALKTITHTVHKGKKGKVQGEFTTTMTVTKLESKSFPKSFFDVPTDYERKELAGPKKMKLF